MQKTPINVFSSWLCLPLLQPDPTPLRPEYRQLSFSPCGTRLACMGSAPDYALEFWDVAASTCMVSIDAV